MQLDGAHIRGLCNTETLVFMVIEATRFKKARPEYGSVHSSVLDLHSSQCGEVVCEGVWCGVEVV